MDVDVRFEDCKASDEIHEKLLKILCSEYLNPEAEQCATEFEKFKKNCGKYLSTLSENFKTPQQIFQKLADEKVVIVGKYEALKGLAEGLHEDVANLIKAAEEKVLHFKDNDDEEGENLRIVQIQMLDGSTKKFQLNSHKTVGDLMVTICEKLGIANPDEYSLVVEQSEDYGTLRRREKQEKSIAKDEEKMEKLRKKLHTDEELDWLDHSKTLDEQGYNDEMSLILRRKFFYSDRNVDKRDPVQLNLLYVQARDSILNGTYSVTQDEAVQFAGLQCQIQYGDHNEEKHKPGFITWLKDFVPEAYVKSSQIEKKIFDEHKKYTGMGELDAKAKYTRRCRSLKTYGIAIFLVKEKVPGKNKLEPILLGVTKDSVVRMDDKTKQILKTWPLTKVRKWAASPNSFILDFGDYQDELYMVQTQEGEQLSKLISGYIDIILKKKRARDHLGEDVIEEMAQYEDSIQPGRAMKILQANMKGLKAYHQRVSEPQKALFQEGASQAQNAETLMDKGYTLPKLGEDMASIRWKENAANLSKEKVAAELSSLNAAAAQIVAMAMDANVENSQVGAAIVQVVSNLHDFAGEMSKLAKLADDDTHRDKLLAAARKLCGAFSDLLNAAQTREGREKLLSMGENLREVIKEVLDSVGKSHCVTDKAYQDRLLKLAEAVSDPIAHMVQMTTDLLEDDDDMETIETIAEATTDCKNAASQLVAMTKVLMPLIDTPACRDRLMAGTSGVADSIDELMKALRQSYGDDSLSSGLSSAVAGVTQALSDLLNHIKKGPGPDEDADPKDEAMAEFLALTDRLVDSIGDSQEVLKHAGSLAKVSSLLEKMLKEDGDKETDPDIQKRLLAAAKQLSDATAKMLEAAKGCAGHPDDPKQEEGLRSAIDNLVTIVRTADGSTYRKQLIKNLELAVRKTMSASTHLLTAASTANRSNDNTTSKTELKLHSATVNEQLTELVQNLKFSENSPDNVTAQLSLVHSSKDFIPPADGFVAACKTAAPDVTNITVSINLNNSVDAMVTALTDLKTATARAEEACVTKDVDGALDMLGMLSRELEEYKEEAGKGKLIPLPGDTAENSAMKLNGASKTVSSAVSKLMRANSQGESGQYGVISHETVHALRALVEATRGVAATSPDKTVQGNIIDSARDVIDKLRRLLEEASDAEKSSQQSLSQLGQAVTNALNKCVNSLPGQVVVDNIIRQITETGQSLPKEKFPASSKKLEELQQEMDKAAEEFNKASGTVLTASRGLPQLAEVSNRYISVYKTFINAGMTLAGKSDPETQKKIVSDLQGVSTVASQLLMAAKKFAADPNQPNAKKRLQDAARAVTDSINQLINACTTQTPEQRECDNACRHMEMMKSMLENTSEAMSDMTYFQCLDAVNEGTKGLSQAMSGMSDHGKKGKTENFCGSVKSFSGAVGGLTEAAAQAAYLVATTDSESRPGKPGLLDQSQFAQANQAVHTVCQKLINLSLSQQQVFSEAKIVTKHTTDLCKVCKQVASKCTNPEARERFEQSSNKMAEHIKHLVSSLKVLGSSFTEDNRRQCAAIAKPLMEAVDDITVYASSPEFASVPANISPQAKKAQEPILTSGGSVVDSACKLMVAAKHLTTKPKDSKVSQRYGEESKNVTSALKMLVTSLRTAAPGQRECEESVELIRRCVIELDRASLDAISQNLAPRKDKTLAGFQELMIGKVKEIKALVEQVTTSAKGLPMTLGQKALTMAGHFEPLSDAAVGSTSLTANIQQETPLLDLTKTVAESTQYLMEAAKQAGGNPEAKAVHEEIDVKAKNLLEVLQELQKTLEESASQAGMMDKLEEKLNGSIEKVKQRHAMPEGMTYTEYQSKMVSLAKKLARTAQEMKTKAGTSTVELGPYSSQLTGDFDELASLASSASIAVTSKDLAGKIQTATQEIGKGCVGVVHSAGKVQRNSQDPQARKDLDESARVLALKVAVLLAALQAGAKGTEACMNAISNISGILSDLETTILFANAGTLTNEEGKTFADCKKAIAKSAKAMAEDTKTLAGATAHQDKLADAAQQTVTSITDLADVVKLGAAALGAENANAQVLLLSAVKDVASALTDLLNAAKTSAEKPDHNLLKTKKETASTKITALTKTIETIEDEASRGTKALESTIEAIKQEIKAYEAGTLPEKESSPEDLIRLTTPITMATSKAVTAGNSCKQEDVIVCANTSRKAVTDLLGSCRGAASTAETADVRDRTIKSGQKCAEAYRDLLEQVKKILAKPSADGKKKMAELSRKVATAVTDLVQSAQAIKGSDWVDPDDPTVIAENELLGAAKSIEAAAAKLAQLRPRKKTKDADANLTFEDHILEATKGIAAATAALVKYASEAQKELVAQGKIKTRKEIQEAYNKSEILEDDGQWSEGLISAARQVARATENLCDAAHALVQGNASEERLIASAKEVAASTVALVMACKVKADPFSSSMERLQDAGNKVKAATEALVKEARDIKGAEKTEKVVVNKNPVKGIAQEMAAMEEMLKKEKELEKARERLAQIRKEKYKK